MKSISERALELMAEKAQCKVCPKSIHYGDASCEPHNKCVDIIISHFKNLAREERKNATKK